MRNLLIISNWKLHGNKNKITNSLIALTNNFDKASKIHIAIAPPLVYLDIARNCLCNSDVQLCAQNVDVHLSGAFTGDTSALMLQDLNVQYVLIGHSERRIYHKENDLYIAKKFSILKETGLIPVLCIGENQKEYNSKTTQIMCVKQIDPIIKSFGIQSFQNSIIAYEPVWAIGKGISASPKQVQLIHKHIRNYIAQYDEHIANQVLIQYGGSVNSNNVLKFLDQEDIDGVLIGSAALDVNNFLTIIKLITAHINK